VDQVHLSSILSSHTTFTIMNKSGGFVNYNEHYAPVAQLEERQNTNLEVCRFDAYQEFLICNLRIAKCENAGVIKAKWLQRPVLETGFLWVRIPLPVL
jgi:hypothetical protein